MGATTQSFSIDISIVRCKNLELKSHGNLFVRYYLSSGKNRRIQLNTKEISSKSNLSWNDSFSLECSHDSINNLKEQSVVFELRWRNTNPVLGNIRRSSQLLGRAEIPWRTVLESPKMEMDKWVMMVSKKKNLIGGLLVDDVKPPSVQIAMKVEVAEMAVMDMIRNGKKLRKWESDECGCCRGSGCKCQDYEIFALVAAFEAL